jgi:hypothetical protein
VLPVAKEHRRAMDAVENSAAQEELGRCEKDLDQPGKRPTCGARRPGRRVTPSRQSHSRGRLSEGEGVEVRPEPPPTDVGGRQR